MNDRCQFQFLIQYEVNTNEETLQNKQYRMKKTPVKVTPSPYFLTENYACETKHL